MLLYSVVVKHPGVKYFVSKVFLGPEDAIKWIKTTMRGVSEPVNDIGFDKEDLNNHFKNNSIKEFTRTLSNKTRVVVSKVHLDAQIDEVMPVIRHVKHIGNGQVYKVHSDNVLNKTSEQDEQRMTCYSNGGLLYVRDYSEFMKRFTEIRQ